MLASCGGDDGGAGAEGPELGQTVELEPKSGAVEILEPGESKPAPLTESLVVPVETRVDATDGEVTLTSATEDGGTQSGDFSQGAFLVRQEKSSQEVTLALAGGDFGPCRTEAAERDRSTVGGPEVRRLFADAEGEFRTEGNFGSAAVRGTEFLTVDACFGTLTEVDSGEVLVTDFASGREVPLEAGGKFWAAERPGRRGASPTP